MRGRYALGLALAFALMPSAALASVDSADVTQQHDPDASALVAETARDDQSELKSSIDAAEDDALDAIAASLKSDAAAAVPMPADLAKQSGGTSAKNAKKAKQSEKTQSAEKAAKSVTVNKVLSYQRKLIKKVGTQESAGHTICCPSFSCAYGDVVIDGTVHDHDYYGCSCCTWTDWGGGGSWDRCVGNDKQLLREAYDQIRAGKPTVIHVSGVSGEHWICLIGYQNVKNPDRLNLSNFIALDPWDGAQITASDRYTLYGDGCEHVSER